MLEKILVPIDSIEWDNTLNGVETAMEFYEACGIEEDPELIFIHVFETDSGVPVSEKDRIRKLKESKIKDEFDTIEEMCSERGVENIRTITREGEPDEKIVELAQEEGADMIVMGSGKLHDRTTKGKIQKFVYGSVTENVIHKAPCSVLVSRSESQKFEEE